MQVLQRDAPTLTFDQFDTPIGPLLIAGDDEALRYVLFAGTRTRSVEFGSRRKDHPVLAETRRQLLAYLAGELTTFNLPLALTGTEFQLRAWRELQQIPYGETRSYAHQAAAMGSPSAVRAVGSANGRNPLPVVIPCHRVIGKDGSLAGFGGGVELKRWLLALESRPQLQRLLL